MDALRKSIGGGAAAATEGAEEASQEGAQGGGRAEGNADADCRQETGQGDRGEEAGGQTAAEVSLGPLTSKSSEMAFRVLIIGGTGQVGAAWCARWLQSRPALK